MIHRLRRRIPILLSAVVAAALLAGCGAGPAADAEEEPVLPPEPHQVPHEPTMSPTPRPAREFTIGTTDLVTTLDPAGVHDVGSQAVTESVFQTLMTTSAGDTELKPDAARDCIFEQPTVYTCTLQDNLQFHSGKQLQAADVKFSVERAMRLEVPGSSATLLRSIDSVQAPDRHTVRFILAYPDTDIGYALASPAASIVDRTAYPGNELRDKDGAMPIGSGPYRLMGSEESGWRFTRFESFLGYTTGTLDRITLREFGSSDQLEQAVQMGEVDVMWRGLDEPAVQRARASDFTSARLEGARVLRVEWNPESEVADDLSTRVFVSEAVSSRRTLSSLLPDGVEGAEDGLYAAGGLPHMEAPDGPPAQLTLSYDPSMPDGQDLAHNLVRDLNAHDEIEARAVADPTGADSDLHLIDERVATWTARAWLDRYLTSKPAAERTAVETIVTSGLSSTDPTTKAAARRTLQYYAAEDAWLLPLRQDDEFVFVREGYRVDLARLGPGHQLNLAAFHSSD